MRTPWPPMDTLDITPSLLAVTRKHVLHYGTDIRVHGNGFIQIDLPDNKRLNVWGHPDIPRQKVPSQVHDHTFDFASVVLVGSMLNVVYELYSPMRGFPWYDVYRPITREGEDTFLDKVSGPHSMHVARTQLVQTGQPYNMNAFELHGTFVNEPTITIIERRPRLGHLPARVLVPSGSKPDNSFNRYDIPPHELWRIVLEVFSAGEHR